MHELLDALLHLWSRRPAGARNDALDDEVHAQAKNLLRGFAVVHCLGILTSMFSAVFFSRGLVNFWYGRKKKLKSVSIGTVWKPATDTAIAADAK